MSLSIIILLLGFILLVWSADEFTENGEKVAKIFGLSPILIGILIFGFGTSAPEIFVSALAALEGDTQLSIGNALGSNIINIALVLGISALIMPIAITKSVLKKEWFLLIFASLLLGGLLFDGVLSRLDGVILLLVLVVILVYLAKTSRIPAEFDTKVPKKSAKIWLKLLLGLTVLIVSAKMVVWGGVNIATELGVSQTIIGLTLVAFGTSLPELAVSIMSVLKKQYQMIVGNVIGSNLFNTLAVMAMPALIHPGATDPSLWARDLPMVFGLTLMIGLLSYRHKQEGRIERWGGAALIGVLAYYLTLLFL